MIVLLVLWGTTASAWARKPIVQVLELPSRRADVDSTRARIERIGGQVRERLGGEEAAREPSLDDELSVRLARARSLALKGALDEAAGALDAALEDGARAVQRLESVRQEFLAGHFRRALIALARGERERAIALVERALRYQPDLELTRSESTPELRALVDEVRARVGVRPALNAATIGAACRERADVVIVGRRVGDALWMTRLDGCEVVVEVDARDEALAIDQLVRATPRFNPAISITRTPDPRPTRTPRRAWQIAGLSTVGVGVALLAAGIYFGVQRADLRGSFNAGCPAIGCSGEMLLLRGDELHSAETNTAVLSSLGGIALIAGGVVTYFGFRGTP